MKSWEKNFVTYLSRYGGIEPEFNEFHEEIPSSNHLGHQSIQEIKVNSANPKAFLPLIVQTLYRKLFLLVLIAVNAVVID